MPSTDLGTSSRSHIGFHAFVMLLLALGCSRAIAPVTPDAEAADAFGLTGRVHRAGPSLIEAIPGGYTLHFDRESLTAELVPWRIGSGIQGKLYDLDIDQFMSPETIGITGVSGNGSKLKIDYVVTHPFPAPDFTKPISALNRADLGFTGRLIFLATAGDFDQDLAGYQNTSFAKTRAVTNADQFVDPGDLLAHPPGPSLANVFPAKLIVDEALGANGNRIGVPNGGLPRGNYDTANGGWNRTNALNGISNNGWTGYDFLHGGQQAANSVILESIALSGQIDIVLMIKYTDPRGLPFGVNPQVRFPGDPPDIAQFAYRLPNGALDDSRITLGDEANANGAFPIGEDPGDSVNFSVRVRDWDARGTESAESDLSTDPDIRHINTGTSGSPVVTLDGGSINGASIITLTAGGQTGLAGQEILYTGSITSTTNLIAGLTYWTLLRITDPEDAASGRSTYAFGVDPNTLAADPAQVLSAITYQVVPFEVQATNQLPTCGSIAISAQPNLVIGEPLTIDLSGAQDPEGDSINFYFEYYGPVSDHAESLYLTPGQWATETAFNPATDVRLFDQLVLPPVPGPYVFRVRLTDNPQKGWTDCEFSLNVLANSPPNCGVAINESGPFSTPVDFTLSFGDSNDIDSASLDVELSYTGPDSSGPVTMTLPASSLPGEINFDPFTDGRLDLPLERPDFPGSYFLWVVLRDGVNVSRCTPLPFTVE